MTDEISHLVQQVQALEAERDHYRDALRRWGKHDDVCEAQVFGHAFCNCGYREARNPEIYVP